MGQALIHGKGHVGRAEHLSDSCPYDIWHVLATEFLGHVQTWPTAFLDLLESPFKPCRRVYNAVFQAAAFLVANDVQRGEDFGSQLARLVENSRRKIGF